MISRRGFLRLLAGGFLTAAALGGYGFAAEPFRLRTQRHRIRPEGWPAGLRLRIVLLADLHACLPWMSPERIARIVARANALEPDLTLLLGDYIAGHPYVTGGVAPEEWAAALAPLHAPLGVHAILGNHDWWHDREALNRGRGPTRARRALEAVGIPVYENDARRLVKDGRPFWLAGLGDQLAFGVPGGWRGVDDLPGTLAKVTDEAPLILMAHEPDIFPDIPERVALTLSGHTHGGQFRLAGWSPVVPSRFGNRFAWGHVVERRTPQARPRDLIVSGGLGCSIIPFRLGVPPEIDLVELG